MNPLSSRRLSKRIYTVSKSKRSEQHIWFTIPNFILGEQTYDQGDCIAHVIGKLVDNGFLVKYLQPNTIFVTWEQWIPSYIRDQHFKKTGILIDEKGNVIDKQKSDHTITEPQSKECKTYTPLSKYKPTGHLLYDAELFDAISK